MQAKLVHGSSVYVWACERSVCVCVCVCGGDGGVEVLCMSLCGRVIYVAYVGDGQSEMG